jgi:RNA polymerase-binding transcription factor DksA
MSHLAKRKSTLLARLGELDRRAHKLDDALDAPKSKDWEESAVEREGDEVMEQMGSAALAEMEGIRAALARFDSGSYGACVDCGAEIRPNGSIFCLPHRFAKIARQNTRIDPHQP